MAAPKLPPAPLDLPSMLEALAAQLRGAQQPPPPADDRPVFLDPRKYAERLGVSEWKVRQLVKLGLPHSRLPGGRKLIRIDVEKADAWVKVQGPVT
jgi:hypothetical protein